MDKLRKWGAVIQILVILGNFCFYNVGGIKIGGNVIEFKI